MNRYERIAQEIRIEYPELATRLVAVAAKAEHAAAHGTNRQVAAAVRQLTALNEQALQAMKQVLSQ